MEDRFLAVDCETTGLFPWEGNEITCICAKCSDGITFVGTTEHQAEPDLILQFLDWLSVHKDHLLITFNGRSFDIPFILARACMNNLLAVRTHHHPFLDMEHLDLIECNYKRLSLRDLAEIYNCAFQKTGTGVSALQLAKDKRFDELAAYCMNDVDTTIAVYHALKAHGRVPKKAEEAAVQ